MPTQPPPHSSLSTCVLQLPLVPLAPAGVPASVHDWTASQQRSQQWQRRAVPVTPRSGARVPQREAGRLLPTAPSPRSHEARRNSKALPLPCGAGR